VVTAIALSISYLAAGDTPERILMWVEVGFVAFFLVLAVIRRGVLARGVGFLTALTVLARVVVVQLGGFPWYFGRHLGLDNGISG
jgi:hypothetical protein